RVTRGHHRAVVRVAHALPRLLALADQLDLQLLPGEHGRLQRVCQIVDVQHLDVLDLSPEVQVEVGGENRNAAVLGDLQQLGVDVGDAGHVDLGRRHGDVGAHVVTDLEPAPPPRALHPGDG